MRKAGSLEAVGKTLRGGVRGRQPRGEERGEQQQNGDGEADAGEDALREELAQGVGTSAATRRGGGQ